MTRLAGVQPAGRSNPQLLLERQVLQAALQTPELLPSAWTHVSANDFTAPASRMLFEALRATPPGDLQAVLDRLPDDDSRTRVRALALADRMFEPDEAHVSELVARLRAAAVQRDIELLRHELRSLRPEPDAEQYRTVVGNLMQLERSRRELLEGSDA